MSYQSVILADKPVAYWPLDDTSGTVAKDASGNENNMVYQNEPTLGAAPIAEGLGASVSLNGTNQFVELATPPASLQLVEGSFEIWCNQTSLIKGAALFTNENAGDSINFAIGQGSQHNNPALNANLFGASLTNNTWFYAGYDSALLANTSYHVVYTNDGNTAKLFINGALAYTGTGNTFTPNQASIYIGAQWLLLYFVEGLLSNAAMYNTVLTAAQILNHYNAGIATPSGSPLYTGGGTDSQFLLIQR
jgi:hypothetical protein